MRYPVREIYFLVFVYKFTPEVYKKNDEFRLRLHDPTHRYWTEYKLGEKIKNIAGVDTFRIFKKKKGYPP